MGLITTPSAYNSTNTINANGVPVRVWEIYWSANNFNDTSVILGIPSGHPILMENLDAVTTVTGMGIAYAGAAPGVKLSPAVLYSSVGSPRYLLASATTQQASEYLEWQGRWPVWPRALGLSHYAAEVGNIADYAATDDMVVHLYGYTVLNVTDPENVNPTPVSVRDIRVWPWG